jgi:hypothetical protein
MRYLAQNLDDDYKYLTKIILYFTQDYKAEQVNGFFNSIDENIEALIKDTIKK